MKKCLNCGTECQDEDLFCPKCGERLIDENVCQKCGAKIDVKDDFCRHCGHKIEKEYKCEQCGTVIDSETKFCPQCGAKVENPVVTIKQKRNAEKKAASTNLMNKITFFVFSGVMILLFVLVLVGCFGDIFAMYETPKNTGVLSLSGADAKISINYFFGKAIEDIRQDTKLMMYPEYKTYRIIMLVFEYLFWVLAIGFAIAGLIYAIVKLCKGYKNKNYEIKSGFYISSILSVLPYLFIFSIEKSTNLLVESASLTTIIGSKTYGVNYTFGWGTMMIFVSAIIAVCFVALQKVAYAISEKKNIVRTSIISAIYIAFFACFMASIGKAVGLTFAESGVSLTGYMSTLSLFENYLVQYSADLIKELPSEAFQCLVGSVLLFFAYLLGSLYIEIIIRKPHQFIYSSIIGVLLIGLTISGSVVSYQGASKAYNASSIFGFASGSNVCAYSAAGIVLPIFALLSIVGIILAQKIKINNKAQA